MVTKLGIRASEVRSDVRGCNPPRKARKSLRSSPVASGKAKKVTIHGVMLVGCEIQGCDNAHGWNRCVVWQCHRKISSRGMCKVHDQQMRRKGEVNVGMFTAGSRMENTAQWIGDTCTYNTMHWRLRKHYGSARDYDCFTCGGDAEHWALYYEPVEKRIDPQTGFPFSTDYDDYRPLCRSCHNRLDKGRR